MSTASDSLPVASWSECTYHTYALGQSDLRCIIIYICIRVCAIPQIEPMTLQLQLQKSSGTLTNLTKCHGYTCKILFYRQLIA